MKRGTLALAITLLVGSALLLLTSCGPSAEEFKARCEAKGGKVVKKMVILMVPNGAGGLRPQPMPRMRCEGVDE